MRLIAFCKEHEIGLRGIVPFGAVHLVALIGLATVSWSPRWLSFCLAVYTVRMFFVTAGYHRYFSHRAFETGRTFQFILAVCAMTSTQKGPLWWAAHHRRHHRYSDTPDDPHSAYQNGFWWAHVGWVLSDRFNKTTLEEVRDLLRFPELVWLNRSPNYLVPPVAFAVVLLLFGGWPALVWGFFFNTVLLWHWSFSINSLAHLVGVRRYETPEPDRSKNSWWLAIPTLGEGWHNNHHRYPSSARQGFVWWQYDLTYAALCLLALCGIVQNLQRPTPDVVAEGYAF